MFSLTSRNNPKREQTPLRKNVKGFTLLELLVVVAIIGALAAIAIPVYNSYVDKARITLSHGALDTIRKTLESYHIDYQRYPATIDFTTGGDDLGRTIFQGTLLEQINSDLASFDSYVSDTTTYTLIVKAVDSDQTVMTLTPREIIY